MKSFVIWSGPYLVARFNHNHGVVKTLSSNNARKFRSRREAEDFIETYGDAGYGMTKQGAKVQEVVL